MSVSNNPVKVLNRLTEVLEENIKDRNQWFMIPTLAGAFRTEMSEVKKKTATIEPADLQKILKISAKFEQIMTRWETSKTTPVPTWGEYLSGFVWTTPATPPTKLSANQTNLVFASLVQTVEASITTEGLYRLSGAANNISKTVTMLQQNPYSVIDSQVAKDIHNITGIIKALFREMDIPLLQPAQDALMKAESISDVGTKKAALAQAISQLPLDNQKLLKQLLNHLRTIASESKTNKMAPANLATCFAPNLFAPSKTKDTLEVVQENMAQNSLLLFLIENPEF